MYEYKFTLDRVIDGDTIDVVVDLGFDTFIKKRIRLLGIDAPETRLQSKIKDLEERKKEKERGLLAKQELTNLLKGKNKTLIARTKLDKSGKYGRILAEIFVEESGSLTNINNLLLLGGYVEKYS
jgi:micrococcal nuclease